MPTAERAPIAGVPHHPSWRLELHDRESSLAAATAGGVETDSVRLWRSWHSTLRDLSS